MVSRVSRPVGWPALAALLVVLWVGNAGAVTFLETAGAPSSRHPFAARILPVGPASAYFNPALMVDDPSSVFAGPFAYIQRLSVDLDPRPTGIDVLASHLSAAGSPGTLPTAQLASRGADGDGGAGFFIGQGNATQLIPDRLAMGFYLLLPGAAWRHESPFYVDEREQAFSNSLHFELLGDRMETVAFSFAVSGRPWEWLSVGAGISLAFASRTTTTLIAPSALAPDADAQLLAKSDLDIRVAPHAAVALRPIPPLTITITAHMPYSSVTDGETQIISAGTGSEPSLALTEQHHTYGYLPWRVGLGVAWAWDETKPVQGTLAASLLWSHWTSYEDRTGSAPEDAWQDTVTAVLSGDVRVGAHALGLDVMFVQSPVPPQRGRSNYVDNHRIGFAAGWDWSFDLDSVVLVAGLQLQFQYLLPRSVTKSLDVAHPVLDEVPDDVAPGLQTNNPGYPGYSSHGWLLGTGASLRVQF